MKADSCQTQESCWSHNLKVLESYRPELYKRIKGVKYKPVGELMSAASGDLTLRFALSGEPNGRTGLAYGLEDPWRDISAHLETVPAGSRGLAVFVGMGLGYGPLLVFREREELPQIAILEPSIDLFCTALHAVDLSQLISSPKVHFFVGEINWQQVQGHLGRLASLADIHILRHVPSFLWAPQSYSEIDNKAFMLLNQINAGGSTTKKSGPFLFKNRLENLKLIQRLPKLKVLKDLFQQKPAVLVAAGPSLDQSIPELKKIKGRCVLIAADSALAPLLNHGIEPDFVTSIDYQNRNFEKILPFLGRTWPFSLVALIKSTPLVGKRFTARHLFMAFQEDIPQSWVIEALKVKELVPPASSVAHLSLGLALHLGADPIFFVGQDLAYTSASSDHAQGAIFESSGPDADREIFYIDGVDGKKVATDRQFLGMKKIFEDIIAENKRAYFNASHQGAHISGTQVRPLSSADDFFQEMVPVQQHVDRAVEKRQGYSADDFIKVCRGNLNKINKLMSQLQEVHDLQRAINNELRKVQKKGGAYKSMSQLPPALVRKLEKYDAVNRSIDLANDLWEHVLELTFEDLSENDSLRAQNDKVLNEKGYFQWLQAELSRVGKVNYSRKEALLTYQKDLKSLVSFLEQERCLLKNASSEGMDDLLALVEHYALAEEPREAGKISAKLLERHPDIALVNFWAGAVSLGLLRYSEADFHFKKALAGDPKLALRGRELRLNAINTWVDMVESGIEHFDVLLALYTKWFERIARLLGNDIPLPTEIADLWVNQRERLAGLILRGETEEFCRLLQPWGALSPWLDEYYLLAAQGMVARGEKAAAITAMAEVCRKGNRKPEWLAFYTRLLLEAGLYEEGLSVLQEAVALDPTVAVIWEEIGESLAAAGNFSDAALAYEKCFVALPEQRELLQKIGDCYLRSRKPEAALAAYDAFLEKAPDAQTVQLHLNRAYAMKQIIASGKETSN